MSRSKEDRMRQAKSVEEISDKAEETLDSKRGDKIMIKTRHFFFPPTLTHKAWYGHFTIARVS